MQALSAPPILLDASAAPDGLAAVVPPTVLAHFADLADPRVARTRLHPLLSVVAIALCGVICGADSWVEVAAFGAARRAWLATWLALPGGIPSHDTFGRVFAALDPAAFEGCFAGWVGAVAQATGGQVVAIDGKVARGSHDRRAGRGALDLVSAWASSSRLVLGQVAVAEGSNEIPAIPALLALLALRGCIVTIDAIGCQTAVAGAIAAQGADDAITLKENQGNLFVGAEAAFADLDAGAMAYRHTSYREVDKGHGRLEVRTTTLLDDPALLAWLTPAGAWAGLAGRARVVAERRIGSERSRETRYFITSLTAARTVHVAIRRHWGIENSVHWVLDRAFREDLCRVRVGHGAHVSPQSAEPPGRVGSGGGGWGILQALRCGWRGGNGGAERCGDRAGRRPGCARVARRAGGCPARARADHRWVAGPSRPAGSRERRAAGGGPAERAGEQPE